MRSGEGERKIKERDRQRNGWMDEREIARENRDQQ